MDRAWRWCIVRTLRDLRLSIRRGRPISRPNLERLFCRRWHWAASRAHEDASERLVRGRRMIRRLYSAWRGDRPGSRTPPYPTIPR